jgi:hypothetical protein
MADSIINGTHDFQRGSEFGGRRGWPKSLYLVEPPSLGDSDDSGGVGVTGDLSGGSSGSATPPTVTCPVRRAKYADIVTSAVRSSSIRPSVSVPLSSVVRVTGKGAPCGPTVPPPSPSPTNGGLSPTPPNPNPAPRSPFFSFSSSPTITAIPIEALTAASAAALPATKDGRSVTALKLVIDSFAEEPRGSVAPEPPQPTSAVVAPVDPKPASKASASASASSGSAMTGGAPTTGRKRASTSNADEPQRYRKRPYGHSCLVSNCYIAKHRSC